MKLSDFQYELPEERIAKFPLKERDHSKLLVFNNEVEDLTFKHLPSQLGKDCCLFFNNTKVIPARLSLFKDTGARIEIFLLHPVKPTNLVQLAMEEKGPVVWKTMIGNSKKWKNGQDLKQDLIIDEQKVLISCKRINPIETEVEISWNSDHTFSEIVEALGKIPLPPYLNRDTQEADYKTYQTVYSKEKGAVAAPTAGLHFTPYIFEQLQKEGVEIQELTLHVGAGTFMPVKHDNVMEHPMHNEQIVVSKAQIDHIAKSEKKIIPVGTTSMRSIESLYWYGVMLSKEKQPMMIEKDYPYNNPSILTQQESFSLIADYMEERKLETLIGETEIMIRPGYDFKVCQGLITNFHQPGSTLIMLIAALVGENWRMIYQHALKNDYRFLSYGDSSLLWPSK